MDKEKDIGQKIEPPVRLSEERIAGIREFLKGNDWRTGTLSGRWKSAISDLLSDRAAILRELETPRWWCFHCDEVFVDQAAAREHFGADDWKTPACRLSAEDVTQLRELEEQIREVRAENCVLENDARLWYESEADRVRRIGHVQWWQELDYREGEKIVLKERAEQAEAALARLTQERDRLREALINLRDYFAYGQFEHTGMAALATRRCTPSVWKEIQRQVDAALASLSRPAEQESPK